MQHLGKIVSDDVFNSILDGTSSRIKRFLKTYENAYCNAIQRASVLATGCGTKFSALLKAIYDQLLSCSDQSPTGIENRGSILSQAVQFYEASGDYLQAQKSQELLLALLAPTAARGEDQAVLSAVKKLIDLYERVSTRLGSIAERLGLDVPAVLFVYPVLHRAIRQNNVLLVSKIVDRVAQYDENDVFGRDALHCACESRALPIVQFLIDKGYHLNQ